MAHYIADSKDYQAYKAAVAHSMKVNNLLSVHSDGEPHVSSSMCALCGDRQQGMREYANGLMKDSFEGRERIIAVALGSICEDCVYYAEYGRLDDRTMMRVKA